MFTGSRQAQNNGKTSFPVEKGTLNVCTVQTASDFGLSWLSSFVVHPTTCACTRNAVSRQSFNARASLHA
eukprot:3829218-Prymnesium_polylepis.1